MENIYIIMLVALALLAVADLVVGVSNDAVNFLNSAIGSKAVSFRTIMIIASIGIAFGALSSSGMMEVARKGIFVPGQFYFNEIMIIFMAVMITDILLLDFFNSLGLPTSTTVSIVFELLGAAVCISIIKINKADGNILQLGDYINSAKATEIIVGILLSVVVAFTIGALVQYISRLWLSFNIDKKPIWTNGLFGGIALSAIAYFIIIKGLKGAAILPESFNSWAQQNLMQFVVVNLVFWSAFSAILSKFFNLNIYKLVIVLGTFALAMAFAGNDLVNFIGVPMAAYQSYLSWMASGVEASAFSMESLAAKVPTQPLLLMAAGLVMVLTLWFSEKARRVVKTSVDLSRQDEGSERFRANLLSQQIVRAVIVLDKNLSGLLPQKLKTIIQSRFKPAIQTKVLGKDAPAFDMVRAAVNLIVASILISIATGMKLPLSTTYVTFMVAMGTSLADKAWGSDSAVYRVAGVLNVIGGWFLTALTAFTAAALMAFILYKFELFALIGLFVLALVLLGRNYLKSKSLSSDFKAARTLVKAESNSLEGILTESSNNITQILQLTQTQLPEALEHLGKQNLSKSKKTFKRGEHLEAEMEALKMHVFAYIRNKTHTDAKAAKVYLQIQDYLEDISQSVLFFSKACYQHLKNNHRGLTFNQVKDLRDVIHKIDAYLQTAILKLKDNQINALTEAISQTQDTLLLIESELENQILRTKQTDEVDSKNTSLYFSLLLECKDITQSISALLGLLFTTQTQIEDSKII